MSLIAAVYNSVLGLRKRTWASGMTVKKNEVVKSPADNEDYERITATGAGTTAPADDITNYVARSYVRTSALRQPGNAVYAVNWGGGWLGMTTSTLTSLALGTRTSFLNVTGRGSVSALATSRMTAGGWRVEVIADGRVIYDTVLMPISTNLVHMLIGSAGADAGVGVGPTLLVPGEALQFRRSLQVFCTPTNAGGGAGAGNPCGIGYILGSAA